MLIKATVTNNQDNKEYIGGRSYLPNKSVSRVMEIDRYNRLENSDLDIEIETLMYDNLEDLEVNELKLIAKYHNIDGYWNMTRETLMKEINNVLNEKETDEEEEKIENKELILEGDN